MYSAILYCELAPLTGDTEKIKVIRNCQCNTLSVKEVSLKTSQ